ncbi:type II toxin-antitoxin system RelE/ParE family toxin [Algoriphagus marinus]|uniref:type II toxin-antitoxin system RelE/ParE family toxin n=1 Tax=Algoriphagus marinus TaxID=1925762 RepID=UPI00094BB07A|nr:type II toxin-antitoxin system RelE/ParE family toxin [Algoriphagus marinus]
MGKYKFTKKAVTDLSSIWEYTCQNWSETQADRYYETLISACEEIANNQGIGKNYEGIADKLFGMKTSQHIIFYRILDNTHVEITRILHGSMDLKNRIKE